MDQVDLMDQMDKTGASCDTPWVCMPQFGLAGGINVPVGFAGFFMATVVCGGGGVALAYGPGGPDGPNGQCGGAIV